MSADTKAAHHIPLVFKLLYPAAMVNCLCCIKLRVTLPGNCLCNTSGRDWFLAGLQVLPASPDGQVGIGQADTFIPSNVGGSH